jgi:hypothetical protein
MRGTSRRRGSRRRSRSRSRRTSATLTLRARNLPAPLGLLVGLLRARGFTWRERVATIRWFAALRRAEFRCADGATVADIIAPLPPHVRDNLWAPLCVAALNTPATEASAQVFLNVLREAFGGAANAAQMVVARSGLAAAFPEQAADWLRARGHAVGLSSRLRVIDADDIRLADATGTRRADAAVVAVGPHQLATAFDPTLATGDAAVGAALRQVAALAWQPIVTAYLGYEASVALPRGLVRLDDSPASGCSIAATSFAARRRRRRARHSVRCCRSSSARTVTTMHSTSRRSSPRSTRNCDGCGHRCHRCAGRR